MVLEIIGYVGSFLVVVSMLMSSIVKLRVINTVGSVISGIYAVICGAYPLAFMNLCLIIINVYNLLKLLKTPKSYELIESSPGESLVKYFLEHYKKDIGTFFPGFDQAASEKCDEAFVVCREGSPVGVMLGTRKGGSLDVVLDYTTPAYRDCSVGSYLYPSLAGHGISSLHFSQKLAEGHRSYLQKMGYRQEGNEWILNTRG